MSHGHKSGAGTAEPTVICATGQAGGLRRGTRAGLLAALVAVASVLCGCTADSWFDQSVVGRWEHTPTVAPILERIAAIEVGDESYVQTSEIMPEDLIPQVTAYRIGPGDQLDIRIRDFSQPGTEEEFQRVVDARGMLSLPRLPPIRATGRTEDGLRQAIVDAIREAQIKENAVVSVQVTGQRQQTFSAFGSVANPGSYFIPEPDYRLLDALAAAGGFAESVPELYVIRQIPLSEKVTGRGEEEAPTPEKSGQPKAPPSGEKTIDLINELAQPQQGGKPEGGEQPKPESGSAGQPESDGQRKPAVDLVEPPTGTQKPPAGAEGGKAAGWKYLNGRWVKVIQRAEGAPPQPVRGADGESSEDLVTQRVIEVPTKPLLAGSAKYNIVIRAGDVIRVPNPASGLVYVTGQVSRPGPFNMPSSGRLTLLRAIDAAGGLSQLAVPERCDLTRMVGTDKQATIRLNLRAIAEQTQPDIFLKPDDRINIGTDFWAFPLAVVRNGFRASYGFGFLLDRNFGNDVFGAPPTNQFGQ